MQRRQSGEGPIAVSPRPTAAADIVIFDPRTITDRSTWDEPNLMAEGVRDVYVNGVAVLLDGKLTGDAPGKFVPRQR